MDRLCVEGVRLARHYSQAAPCAPGRAALYTGTYQMNNRVVANGSPLAERFD
ncbi:sulfatase (sulfuric ester hydrolase) protein, partial [mine drainage metagenome]